MQARINDVVINYEIEGPDYAPVVTLSHTLATSLNLWDFQSTLLRDSFRVLRFDTRGHGLSSAPLGPYTMESLSEDVVGLLDHLKISKTDFVGISLGGMIGQMLAVTHPERLGRLVLCDTTSSVPPEMAPVWEERIRKAQTEGMTAMAQETLDRWLSEEFQRNHPDVTDSIRNMIHNTPIRGYAGCCRAISSFDVSGKISRIAAPTLILVGEKDPGTPVSASETIRQQIRNSRMVIIPEALHLTNIEAAEVFNKELVGFLKPGLSNSWICELRTLLSGKILINSVK
jgi:3-oxoadipate enol-lactonase